MIKYFLSLECSSKNSELSDRIECSAEPRLSGLITTVNPDNRKFG